jgi:hypothetical protein
VVVDGSGNWNAGSRGGFVFCTGWWERGGREVTVAISNFACVRLLYAKMKKENLVPLVYVCGLELR